MTKSPLKLFGEIYLRWSVVSLSMKLAADVFQERQDARKIPMVKSIPIKKVKN